MVQQQLRENPPGPPADERISTTRSPCLDNVQVVVSGFFSFLLLLHFSYLILLRKRR